MMDDEVGHTEQEMSWAAVKERTKRIIHDKRESDARAAVAAFVIMLVLAILVTCLGKCTTTWLRFLDPPAPNMTDH